jgi:predicted negative regulator of RcsB-dependent stress response
MTAHKRHPSSRRKPEEPTKKEAEDIFVEKILETTKWAKANGQTLVLAGIVAVVVIAGSFYYFNYRTTLRDQAIAQLESVQGAVGAGAREEAEAQLYQYLDRFDGTVYALEARLILGQILLENDDPEGAMEVLAPAVREMEDQPIGLQAGFLMAAAYEEVGRAEEAERMFLRIADASEMTFQVREALSGAARIRTTAGDRSGAAELYSDVLATMEPTDPTRTYWEMRLAEVSAGG